jgi:hypothetical protein
MPRCRSLVRLTNRTKQSASVTRERAGRDQSGSRAQGSRCEIKLSQARSVRTRCDHVANRDCDRSDFCAYEETPLLARESAFWGCRLRVPHPRGNREIEAIDPARRAARREEYFTESPASVCNRVANVGSDILPPTRSCACVRR